LQSFLSSLVFSSLAHLFLFVFLTQFQSPLIPFSLFLSFLFLLAISTIPSLSIFLSRILSFAPYFSFLILLFPLPPEEPILFPNLFISISFLTLLILFTSSILILALFFQILTTRAISSHSLRFILTPPLLFIFFIVSFNFLLHLAFSTWAFPLKIYSGIESSAFLIRFPPSSFILLLPKVIFT
jgi:hypothetical protein